eukprot:425050-Rhodomonas_salina.1
MRRTYKYLAAHIQRRSRVVRPGLEIRKCNPLTHPVDVECNAATDISHVSAFGRSKPANDDAKRSAKRRKGAQRNAKACQMVTAAQRYEGSVLRLRGARNRPTARVDVLRRVRVLVQIVPRARLLPLDDVPGCVLLPVQRKRRPDMDHIHLHRLAPWLLHRALE